MKKRSENFNRFLKERSNKPTNLTADSTILPEKVKKMTKKLDF
jgi:hypothetical protein